MSPVKFCFLLALVGCLPMALEGTFTDHFRQFLKNLYGQEIADSLSRLDLGDRGSSGGANSSPVQVKHRPIIFVHGLSSSAGNLVNRFLYFQSRNYSTAETYGTTYGSATIENNTDSVVCDNVLRIRRLIVAVALYTNSLVDVIAYSLGSPTSRKAILGGRCVDTNKYLGPPLTALVHTWMSVAGANYGSLVCYNTSASLSTHTLCTNQVTGTPCHSKIIDNINFKSGYEAASKRYTLYSTADEVVGYKGCAENYTMATIKGQTQGFELSGPLHMQMPAASAEYQYNLTVAGQDGVHVTPLSLALLGQLIGQLFGLPN